jgi:hypothetical protein
MWKRFSISYRGGRILEMWKEKKSMEFFQPYRNLPQTEMWKITSYQKTFLKFVKLNCGRDLQYPTGVEELLKCGRKRRAWNFVQLYRNLLQTEMWKIISCQNKFLNFF